MAILPVPKKEAKLQQIRQIRIELGDIVRRALTSAQASDSNNVNGWLTRINPKYIRLSKYFSMWYNGDFSTLSDTLDLIGRDDADVLKEGSDYMDAIVDDYVTIYDLNPTQVEDLVELAESSFGDFTNILRTFLHAEYGVSILRPEDLLPRGDFRGNNEENKNLELDNYAIMPNPTTDCVKVIPINNGGNNFKLELYNPLGNLLLTLSNQNSTFCMSGWDKGVYLMRVFNNENGSTETHKIILN